MKKLWILLLLLAAPAHAETDTMEKMLAISGCLAAIEHVALMMDGTDNPSMAKVWREGAFPYIRAWEKEFPDLDVYEWANVQYQRILTKLKASREVEGGFDVEWEKTVRYAGKCMQAVMP